MARTSGKLLLVYATSTRGHMFTWVHRERQQSRYPFMMQPKYVKATVSIGWVMVLAVVAFFGQFTSSALILLAVLAVVAPLVLMWFWRPPVQTTSQRIQDVLR